MYKHTHTHTTHIYSSARIPRVQQSPSPGRLSPQAISTQHARIKSMKGCIEKDGGGAKMLEEQDGETTFSPTNSLKEHLNAEQTSQNNLTASRRHQVPRKAAHHLQKEVGQNIKDKKRNKRARDGDLSREGSHNRGSFQTPGNLLTGGSGGSFRILEGNLTGRKNK